MPAQTDIKALTFDVFGTVVDWRASISADVSRFAAERNLPGASTVDWSAFADAWRALYQPAMQRVRSGELGWVKLDTLHRMNLDQLIASDSRFALLQSLDEADLDHLNRVWHRLNPWPDVVAGLTQLKKRYILATLSNGNVALMVNMAKRAGLPWDVILGAEVARHYKPQPQAYLSAAELLGLAPEQCLMVAAHNDDLIAAAKCGLRTAFVPRPTEYGSQQSTDLSPTAEFDVVAKDFNDLACQLGG